MQQQKLIVSLILMLLILVAGGKAGAFSSEPIEDAALISGNVWTQESKTNDERHELSSVNIYFENVDTGEVYRADIKYQYSYTMAFYTVEVPAGTYVVDKMKVVEATTHHTYWGNGFDWKDTVGPNGTASQNFYFY